MTPPLGTSWWLEEAAAALGDAVSEPLVGEVEADVCVVGGGFTGLWTALAVKERDPKTHVVLLEADRCGSGPSGRNGGFLHGYWASIKRACEVLGTVDGVAVARASEGIIPAVRALGEDVWLREGGMLMVSTTPEQDAAVDGAIEAAAAAGRPDQAVPLSREDVAERIRSPRFRRGAFMPDCATVQPARLVRALRDEAIAAGVELHERSPVRRPEDLRGAKSIVLATNAWMTGWLPVHRRVTNFGSYVVLTEPVPELVEEIGWTGGEAVVDGRMFIHYFRTTNDGRVLMGSGSGPIGLGGRVDERFTHDGPTAARAELGLRRLLPGLGGARVERAWGGPIDVSADHLPFVGTVKGTRIHYALGYSGNGVGPSWLCGQVLASRALGRDDEWAASPLVRTPPSLPPEPFKRIGGGLVRAAILACEEAEEAGRRPSVAARAGAAVPRRLGMRIGTR